MTDISWLWVASVTSLLATTLAVARGLWADRRSLDDGANRVCPRHPTSSSVGRGAGRRDVDPRAPSTSSGHDLFSGLRGDRHADRRVTARQHLLSASTSLMRVRRNGTWTRDELGDTRTCAVRPPQRGQSEQVPGMTLRRPMLIKDLHGLLPGGWRGASIRAGRVLVRRPAVPPLRRHSIRTRSTGSCWSTPRCPSSGTLDPPGIAPQVEAELNANAERIDFYGAGATTEAVLDRLPEVPITYMFALQQDRLIRRSGRAPTRQRCGSSCEICRTGRLVEFDTTHVHGDAIPAPNISRLDPSEC